MTQFVGQRPVYIYDGADRHSGADRLAQLGDYILEGSKAGAAAAAVHVSHQVLPLDAEHFGRVCGHTIRAAEHLFERLQEMSRRLAGACRIAMPVEPDTNLVCIAVNPAGNNSLARMLAVERAHDTEATRERLDVVGAVLEGGGWVFGFCCPGHLGESIADGVLFPSPG